MTEVTYHEEKQKNTDLTARKSESYIDYYIKFGRKELELA